MIMNGLIIGIGKLLAIIGIIVIFIISAAITGIGLGAGLAILKNNVTDNSVAIDGGTVVGGG